MIKEHLALDDAEVHIVRTKCSLIKQYLEYVTGRPDVLPYSRGLPLLFAVLFVDFSRIGIVKLFSSRQFDSTEPLGSLKRVDPMHHAFGKIKE